MMGSYKVKLIMLGGLPSRDANGVNLGPGVSTLRNRRERRRIRICQVKIVRAAQIQSDVEGVYLGMFNDR